jgi:hypothetical protein
MRWDIKDRSSIWTLLCPGLPYISKTVFHVLSYLPLCKRLCEQTLVLQQRGRHNDRPSEVAVFEDGLLSTCTPLTRCVYSDLLGEYRPLE